MPTRLPERFRSIIASKILTVALTAALIGAVSHLAATIRDGDPPAIGGWDWSLHKQAALIYYKGSSCGCDNTLHRAVMFAKESGSDIVIATNLRPMPDFIKREGAYEGAYIADSINPREFLRVSGYARTTVWSIYNGRIRSISVL